MNLLLIGNGKWGQNYVKTCQEFPINLTIANKSNWIELINSKSYQGVIIATPPNSHVKIALEALKLNIPVIIEKPISLSYHETLSLKPYENIILVNYTHLFSPAFERLSQIDFNEIQNIKSIGSNIGPIRGYSCLYDYGPHDLSMGLYLNQNHDYSLGCCYKSNNTNQCLYTINVSYDKINHNIIIGNDFKKTRYFEVNLKNKQWIYDDLSIHKLYLNKVPQNIDNVLPLHNLIRVFINLIEGKPDSRIGLGLSLKVMEILQKISYMDIY